MKRVLLMAMVFLMLTGCEALTFSVDKLLKAPNIADEQAAIHQALIESTGRSITLAYPRNGDYLSAFVIRDIDGDETDEALVFYTPSGFVSEQNVRIAVLDKDSDGKWHAMYELAGNGTSIDTVRVSEYEGATDIIIGYGTALYDENRVSIYRYKNGVLASIFDGTYTMLDLIDIDSCGDDEIVTIKKLGTDVTVSAIKTKDAFISEVKLSASASAISGFKFGKLMKDAPALFVDVVDETASLVTEVVTMSDGRLCVLSQENQLPVYLTRRSQGYKSMDFDGDGIVEVPVLTSFMGYADFMYEPEFMTIWTAYDPQTGAFRHKSSSYYSPESGYVFKLPNRWVNFVTVIKDKQTKEITFVKYDAAIESISDMQKLISIASVDRQNVGSYMNNGYNVVKSGSDSAIMVKTHADIDEPLMLTSDEISSNIYKVEKSSDIIIP